MSGHGRCIQGVNGASPGARARGAAARERAIRSGASTHRGTLCYSFDFKLAVGTPVHAVRGGVVAAVVQHFSGGGAKAHLAPRANFVAVRHDDGSYARYYHLRTDGSLFKVGDSVEAGQHIAFSGNTGYTGGPHLHLDVVNLLPEETSRLRVVEPKSLARLVPTREQGRVWSASLARVKAMLAESDGVVGDWAGARRPPANGVVEVENTTQFHRLWSALALCIKIVVK